MGTKRKKAKKPREYPLSTKARKFAEIMEDNGTQAAREAGYKGNDNVLAVTASRLLRNAKVLAIIEKRQKAEKSARVANRTEREEILSEILRNKKVCEVDTPIGAEIGVTEDNKLKFVKVAVSDKNKIGAIDTLNKMDGLYVTKHQVGGEDGRPLDLSLKVTFVKPKPKEC